MLADLCPQSCLGVVCDFVVVITATFRTLHIFVIMEIESRRVLHHNVTSHPTAEWMRQFGQHCLAIMPIA